MAFEKGHKINIGNKWNLGKKHSEESKRKMSEAKKGNQHTLGKHWKASEKGKENMSKAHMGQKKSPNAYKFPNGENHWAWKDGRSKNKKYRSWIKNSRNRKKRNAEGFHTFEEWENLKEKFNFTCLVCSKKEPEIQLTEDHIIALSRGGNNYIDNIQPLCRSCNSKKWNKIINLGVKS